jgi:hypothetical protein
MISILSALWLAYYSLSSIYYLLVVLCWTPQIRQNGKIKAGTWNHFEVDLYTKKSTVSQIILSDMNTVSEEKKQVIMNLYLSGIGEEFIAMQLDLEIPTVISILKALDVYGKSDAGLT